MYVCLCKAVTDKTIKQKVAEGVSTMRELKMCTGLGSQWIWRSPLHNLHLYSYIKNLYS